MVDGDFRRARVHRIFEEQFDLVIVDTPPVLVAREDLT
jgi:Mrp family chromosome partitioning ATPase